MEALPRPSLMCHTGGKLLAELRKEKKKEGKIKTLIYSAENKLFSHL
jgi:hypothetical protein